MGSEPLSEREYEVLGHLPSHLNQQQIADLLHISFNTTKSHTKAIYRKLNVTTRAAAVAEARLRGLLPPYVEPAPTYRITTYFRLAPGTPGMRQVGSKRLTLSQALEWVLQGFPEDALTTKQTRDHEGVIIMIDWSKVEE